jgi:hypothetical protein
VCKARSTIGNNLNIGMRMKRSESEKEKDQYFENLAVQDMEGKWPPQHRGKATVRHA